MKWYRVASVIGPGLRVRGLLWSVDRCNLILKVVKLLIYLLSALGAHGRLKSRERREKEDRFSQGSEMESVSDER
jgi:hypothetical protein